MSRSIHLLKVAPDRFHGTIHVWGDQVDGYSVSQESETGNSWGEVQTFPDAETAIAAAHDLNGRAYEGLCRLCISDAALDAVCGPVGLASLPGEF